MLNLHGNEDLEFVIDHENDSQQPQRGSQGTSHRQAYSHGSGGGGPNPPPDGNIPPHLPILGPDDDDWDNPPLPDPDSGDSDSGSSGVEDGDSDPSEPGDPDGPLPPDNPSDSDDDPDALDYERLQQLIRTRPTGAFVDVVIDLMDERIAEFEQLAQHKSKHISSMAKEALRLEKVKLRHLLNEVDDYRKHGDLSHLTPAEASRLNNTFDQGPTRVASSTRPRKVTKHLAAMTQMPQLHRLKML